MQRVLIEGWRGVSHSFALVNQCQILEMLKHPDIQLFHRDVPFAFPHWNKAGHDAGFNAVEQQQIAALGEPDDQPLDWVYRIASPFRSTPRHPCKVLTFMVTELGLSPGSCLTDASGLAAFTEGDNLIVTPTRWSRDRIVEFGFDASKVHVVPHGVRADTYQPMLPAERSQVRSSLGYRDDEVVFLNLGVSTWNKGVDLVLVAFATLRRSGLPVRLILKDQRSLYGISVDQVLKEVSAARPELFDEQTLAAISVVSVNLSQAGLRQLYAIADAYVSPYRAEGFNLPVLEAIACGTPVVVTQGGATDDFCNGDVALMVPSRAGVRDLPEGQTPARYHEPDLEALIDAMRACATGRGLDPQRREQARVDLVKKMNWASATQALLDLAELAHA
jgi:glycosyltransferase involved in cell wall biosynthesis